MTDPRRRMVFQIVVFPILVGFALGLTASCLDAPVPVTVLRVPDGGRMPQAAVDGTGAIHLMYFRVAITGGDLVYVRRGPGDAEWSERIAVNREPRSAIGMGPMDGGDMALVRSAADDTWRLHAVWFLPDPLRFLYARSTVDDTGFEPQRVLWELGDTVVEARPTVKADAQGRVFVAWHAPTVEGADDAHAAMFLMRSNDGGDSFEPPVIVSPPTEGACGCCSPEAFATDDTLWVSYRGAGDNLRRGQRLLTSTDGGHTFEDTLIQAWPVGACPVTTTTFARRDTSPLIAWETEGQVYVAPVDDVGAAVSPDDAPRFRRKNPAIATNQSGETLLAWGDAPGYRAGGTLSWQIFDADGQATSRRESEIDTIASGSGPAVVAMPDDGFVVIY